MPEHFRRHLIIGLVIALIVLPIALRLLRLGPRTWLKRLLTGGAYFLLAVACAAQRLGVSAKIVVLATANPMR